MIYSIKVQNWKEESITLNLSDPWETGIVVLNVDGIGGGTATINSTDMATSDGAWYNSARANIRNITMTLKPLYLSPTSVEEYRHKIYRYFQIKKQVTLTFKTDLRESMITGYVESVSTGIFSQDEQVQISIICTYPFFRAGSASQTIFSGVRPLFEFPFCDDSITVPNPDAPQRISELLNWDWTHPQNTKTPGNENLIKDHDLRLWSGPMPSFVYPNNSWGWNPVNTQPVNQGTCSLCTEGMELIRPATAPSGNSYLTYTWKPTDWTKILSGKYTFTVVTTDGVASMTVDVQAGSTPKLTGGTATTFALGKYLEIKYESGRFMLNIYVMSGYKVIVQDTKWEYSEFNTLTGGETTTTWHYMGETIDHWYVTKGEYGLFRVDIMEDGLRLLDYAQDGTDFIFEQQLTLQRGSEVTVSVYDTSLHSFTCTLPETGNFKSEEITLPNHFTAYLEFDGADTFWHFRIKHPRGVISVNSDAVTIKAVKIEYGKPSTLLTDEGGINPEPEEFIDGEGTLIFGEILIDTRAILDYHGDVDTGMVIRIHFLGQCGNIRIFNINSGEEFDLDMAVIARILGRYPDLGDDIVISTVGGDKYCVVETGGTRTNIIGAVNRDADWLQLTPGDNFFAYEVETYEENVELQFNYTDAYGGV